MMIAYKDKCSIKKKKKFYERDNETKKKQRMLGAQRGSSTYLTLRGDNCAQRRETELLSLPAASARGGATLMLSPKCRAP